jgi:hypothetical protein
MGLAWTPMGGATLYVEAAKVVQVRGAAPRLGPGPGLCGNLGSLAPGRSGVRQPRALAAQRGPAAGRRRNLRAPPTSYPRTPGGRRARARAASSRPASWGT